MKKLFFLLFVLAIAITQLHSQITVADDNNVGIGVTDPDSKLSIGGAGSTYNTLYVENSNTGGSQRAAMFYKTASGTSGGDYSLGILAAIRHNGGYKLVGGQFQANWNTYTNYRTFGIRAAGGYGYNGYNYGVWGTIYGARNGAAIYGGTNGSETYIDGIYAGWFSGDVNISGDLDVDGIYKGSDINLKKEIRLLKDEGTTQIEKLSSLSAIKYKYKTPAELNDFDPEVLDSIKIDPRTLVYDDPKYTRDNIGLSAQEVQQVYPELVRERQNGYLSVNYIGLIPVLVDAIKEQEAEIEILRQEIEKLKGTEKNQTTSN